MYKIHNLLLGRFQLTAVDVDTGEERKLTDWINNAIFDSGLARMTQGTWIDGVSVGTGTAQLTTSSTGLTSFLARSTTVQASSAGRQVTTLPYYWYTRMTYRFAQGAATGTISEVGAGWGNNTLFDGTLITDVNGNPSPVTVRANEFLDVNFELRIYPPMTDITSTVTFRDLVDGSYVDISTCAVTIRPFMLNSDVTPGSCAQAVLLGATGGSGVGSTTIYDGALNDMLTPPGGNILPTTTSVNNVAANPAVLARVGYQMHDTGDANGNHSVVVVPTTLGTFKFSYNPPISKTSSYQLTHNFTLSWGRY